MRRPLPSVAIGMALGIFLATVVGIWSVVCLGLISLLLIWRPPWRSWLVSGCAALVGAAWLLVASPVWPAAYGPAESLMVVQQVEVGVQTTRLTVRLQSLGDRRVPVWNRALASISLQQTGRDVLPGDVLRGEIDWQPPQPVANPGEFNYLAYLQRQGILADVFLPNDAELQVVASGTSPVWAVRSALQQRALSLPGPSGELLSTLLLGTVAGDWAVSWRQAGLAHVLAVSGLHVGLLLAMLLALLARCRLTLRWRYLLGAVALLAYGLLIGPRPAVWRAVIMALIGLLALATGRARDWPSAVAAAAILLLLYNPWLLFDAGWQLSFAATLGVLALSPLITSRLPVLPCRLDRLIGVSLAAQLATLPIVLYHFYLFTPLAVCSNLLILPLLPALLALGTVYLLLAPLVGWLTPLVGWVFGGVIRLVDWLAGLPLMSFSPGQPPLWLVVVAMACLAAAVIRSQRPRMMTGLLCGWLVAMLLAMSWQPLSRWALNRYCFRVLAVGQGASSVLHLPGSRALLFDVGGGSNSVGERIIVPYLRQQGTSRINGIFLSHLDADHVRGLADVLASFPVDCVYLAVSASSQGWYDQLLSLTDSFAVPVRMLRTGDRLADQALRVDIIHPDGELSYLDANDQSLVLELSWPNLRLLLPGDIGSEVELQVLPQVQLPLDVLLVAHHGSAYSSGEQFLGSLSPTVSIISTGPNRYGHPAEEALARLGRYSQQVLRTDRTGAILVWTNLRRYGVSQFRTTEP